MGPCVYLLRMASLTILRTRFLDALLCGFQWYRERAGGHWECWHTDEDALNGDPFGCQPEWFRVVACSRHWSQHRPGTACGAEPAEPCEQYPPLS